jgi:hypothetical protein
MLSWPSAKSLILRLILARDEDSQGDPKIGSIHSQARKIAFLPDLLTSL